MGVGIDVPIYIIVRFVQRDEFNQQHQVNGIFNRLSVLNAKSIFGSDKYPDVGINCIYAFDNDSKHREKMFSELGT